MIAERIGKEYGCEYQRHNWDCWYATHLKYTNPYVLIDNHSFMSKGLAVGICTAQRRVQVVPLHRLLSYINPTSPLEEEEEEGAWLYRIAWSA